jgi:hypothetical protein
MSKKSKSSLANPEISKWLMIATYAVGGLGYFMGFAKLSSSTTEAVAWVAGLSVGVVGVLSMFRHSIFNRSDAVRMGWDLGKRNNFQIEVGFANFAIGAVAIGSVIYNWGVVAQSAITLIYALYFVQVSFLTLIDLRNGRIDFTRFIIMLAQTGLLAYFAYVGLR